MKSRKNWNVKLISVLVLILSSRDIYSQVTITQALNLVKSRCQEINLELTNYKISIFPGTNIKIYYFLAVGNDGGLCMMSVSETSLKIRDDIKCGSSYYRKEEIMDDFNSKTAYIDPEWINRKNKALKDVDSLLSLQQPDSAALLFRQFYPDEVTGGNGNNQLSQQFEYFTKQEVKDRFYAIQKALIDKYGKTILQPLNAEEIKDILNGINYEIVIASRNLYYGSKPIIDYINNDSQEFILEIKNYEFRIKNFFKNLPSTDLKHGTSVSNSFELYGFKIATTRTSKLKLFTKVDSTIEHDSLFIKLNKKDFNKINKLSGQGTYYSPANYTLALGFEKIDKRKLININNQLRAGEGLNDIIAKNTKINKNLLQGFPIDTIHTLKWKFDWFQNREEDYYYYPYIERRHYLKGSKVDNLKKGKCLLIITKKYDITQYLYGGSDKKHYIEIGKKQLYRKREYNCILN